MSYCNIFDCLPSPSQVLKREGGKAKLANSNITMNDDLAYGTMDTNLPDNAAGGDERVGRPKNDRRKTTYTFPIKIMPSPKSTISTSVNQEATEVETQAYYNESLDYNYISSRFAFSLGLRPDTDREAKPRSKSVSKPRVPFKPKSLARSQTSPVAEIKPLQRSRTEPLSRRIFSPLGRDSADEDEPSTTSTITNHPIPPRIPPRRTSTTATLVPSNSQTPPIFSLLKPTPEAILRSSLTSPLFSDVDLNPFSPRPGATFGAMVVDTPPRTPRRPTILQTQSENQLTSLFEALNSHPVIPIPSLPTILSGEPETISEEPEGIPEEPEQEQGQERDLEGMGTGTGIGMGFGIGEEIRGHEYDQDPNTMSGDLTLHWKSSPLSRYTQRTVFWIVPHAKFDVVFGHDETDFNIPVRNSMKWGLGGWGLGGGGGERGRRGERNQFREGIRRGVLKKVEEQSNFSLLHSATNIMDLWLRPPYPTHVSGTSRDSDSKIPLLSNQDENGNDIHDVPLTYPELENQLRDVLDCSVHRKRKHEAKRAVNIWDIRAGKAVLAEQAKGASGEIRKLVGAVVKDVKARDGGKKGGEREKERGRERVKINGVGNGNREGRAPPKEQDRVMKLDKVVKNSGASGSDSGSAAAVPSETPAIVPAKQPQLQTSSSSSSLHRTSHLVTPILSLPTHLLPPTQLPPPQNAPLSIAQTLDLPQNITQSPSPSLNVEFTDSQLQAQIQAEIEREMSRERAREQSRERDREKQVYEQQQARELARKEEEEMQREIQEQMEREIQAQIESETRPALPPRPSILGSLSSRGINDKGVHALISKLRTAHAPENEDDTGEDGDGEEEEDRINEAMSEIAISRIQLPRPHSEKSSEIEHLQLPPAWFGSLIQRFEDLWGREDELVLERRVWRRKFRGVLRELVGIRERRE